MKYTEDLAINLTIDDKHKEIAKKLTPDAMRGDPFALRILADICTDSEASEILKRLAIRHGYPTDISKILALRYGYCEGVS